HAMPRSSEWSSSRAPGWGGATERGNSLPTVPLIAPASRSRSRARQRHGLIRGSGRSAGDRFDRGEQPVRLLPAAVTRVLGQPNRPLTPQVLEVAEVEE